MSLEFYLTVQLKHQHLPFFYVTIFDISGINSAFSWERHNEGLTQILHYEHSFPVLFARMLQVLFVWFFTINLFFFFFLITV